jgi:hypothetical protein
MAGRRREGRMSRQEVTSRVSRKRRRHRLPPTRTKRSSSNLKAATTQKIKSQGVTRIRQGKRRRCLVVQGRKTSSRKVSSHKRRRRKAKGHEGWARLLTWQ